MSYVPYMRHPKTTQEKKAYYSLDSEYKSLCRPNRNARHLPDAYDDYFVRRDSSWKGRRKTKYHTEKVTKNIVVFREIKKYHAPDGYYELLDELSSRGFYYKTERINGHNIVFYTGTRVKITKNAEYTSPKGLKRLV